MKTKPLYKFLRTGLKSEHGDFTWKIGEWYKEDNIKICGRGFHASKTPLQALGYVKGEIIAKVEVRGESVVEDDKSCHEEMRIVDARYWKKEDSVAFSIFAAEKVIENYEKVYPNDSRPRDAIEAAKKWLAEPTKENESAARSAARSAAWSAAESAESAARSAAESAWSAAESAESAARSAESAAESAARSASDKAKKDLIASLDKWFIERIDTLEKVV